jgi:N-acetylglucosaminyl-diphospho-decaprenol L-rhamnosyltransferase
MDVGLDVAIVSYRCEGHLRDCLGSLRAHPASRPMEVRVIDNASADGTAEMVEQEFPEVRLTRAERNLGFAAATNLALREGGAPYALALNPDTKLTAGALDRLLALMDDQPGIGICGPRLVQPGGSFDHAAKRSFPTPSAPSPTSPAWGEGRPAARSPSTVYHRSRPTRRARSTP